MEKTFTGIFEKVGDWYIAYAEELPGANARGGAREPPGGHRAGPGGEKPQGPRRAAAGVGVSGMEPMKVFISSVMRRSLEDVAAEREAARDAVKSYGPVFTPWAFENEPASTKRLRDSYIDEVKTCDLLLLIVGRTMTPSVREEFDTARHCEKPILAFAKDVPDREKEAADVLRLLDAKYATFTHAADLGEKVKAALGQEILHRARPGAGASHPGDAIAELRALGPRAIVRLSPLVPYDKGDEFVLAEVKSDGITLEKGSSDHTVTIPRSRVAELLPVGQREPPTVLLHGRLQWITLKKSWRFFPERPDPNDPLRLGLAREAGRQEPFVLSLGQQLEPKGFRVAWSCRDKLADRLAAGTHEVFYDEDGRYLVSGGAVLVVSRIG